jgi:hypothetical protein
VRLEKARRLVVEVSENIAQGRFPATENQFCPCDFPEYCPYYRHQYMDTTPQTVKQELLPGIAAVDAVERYASLQAQIKELQTQLDEDRQTIIEFCQAEDLNRVFGDTYEATYKLMERTGFSEEDVRAVLEPAGLWEKVMGLDQTLLKQLLADDETPDDIKNRLESLRRVTSTYPQLHLRKRSGEEK